MTGCHRRRRGVFRCTPLTLLLCLSPAMCQLRPDYSDLPGKYCERRPEESRCCSDRMDECGVGILGTVCYCDQFCDRGLRGDCCPDYFKLCLNETLSSQPPDCVYKEKIVPFGTRIMDNCNQCTCSGDSAAPSIQCSLETCLVEPSLLARLYLEADRLGWSAANYSHFWGRTLRSGQLQLLGTDHPDKLTMARTFPIVKVLNSVIMPPEFDARRRPGWSALVGPVQDQGWCGGSWAVSTVGTASDRLSIQTGSRVTLSTQQLLNCVSGTAATRGCRGGQLDRAWHHLRFTGVRSAECLRYRSGRTGLLGRCKHGKTLAMGPYGTACRRRYTMQPPYRIADKEKDIQHEILNSGPVQALLRVEPDFFLYRSGVYRTSQRGEVRSAYHSVRIIGWGEHATGERVTPYWLVANSWGTGWGEQGLFRIRRGTNEADIETFVVGSWAHTEREKTVAAGAPLTASETRKSGRVAAEEDRGSSVPEKKGIPVAVREADEVDDTDGSGDYLKDELTTPTSSPSEPLAVSESELTEDPTTSEITTSDPMTTLGSELLFTELLLEANAADEMMKSKDYRMTHSKEKEDEAAVSQTAETPQPQPTEPQQTEVTQPDLPTTIAADSFATLGDELDGDAVTATKPTLAPEASAVPATDRPATDRLATDRPAPEDTQPGAGGFSDTSTGEPLSREEVPPAERGHDNSATPTDEPQTEGPVTTTQESGSYFSKWIPVWG